MQVFQPVPLSLSFINLLVLTEGSNFCKKMQEPSTCDMVEEISVKARVVDDNTVAESKSIKAPKVGRGAKASKEAVEMWKENGFSR